MKKVMMVNFIRIFSYSSKLKMNIFLNLVLGGSFLGLDDVLHLLSLSFSGGVATESLFAEFQGSLVLTDSEQLNASSFVGGVTNDFSDDIMNESRFFGLLSFVSALAVLVAGELGNFVAFVWADDHRHVFSVSHVFRFKKINFCKFDLRL